MNEFHEMSDKELMDIAESWLSAELRRIPTKLSLTPAQMLQVCFRCMGKVMKNFLNTVEEDDER